jgi:type IV pilus biogenesis protein CpaD/CtpE
MNRRHFLGLAAIALLGAGCATDSAVRNARGTGLKRTYRQPIDRVHAALLVVAAARKLTVVEEDKAQGFVLLHEDGSLSGDRIGVFLVANNERSTTVEVVTRAGLSGIPVPDWAGRLQGDLEQELTPRRPVP